MKYTRFRDIPPFVRAGNWECDFPLNTVGDFIKEHQRDFGLDIDPDFQRVHVWSKSQQIAWLEYLLRGGRSGRVIYMNYHSWEHQKKDKYNDFVLVDGKQRLEAIRLFVQNEIKVFGSFWREYLDPIFLMSRNTLRININTLQTRSEVLQWYLQMNSGGTQHTEQEINKVKKMLKMSKKEESSL